MPPSNSAVRWFVTIRGLSVLVKFVALVGLFVLIVTVWGGGL